MDFDQLVTFLEVAKLGSFSRAGQKVFRSQSAVSAQIRQLEQEYGDRLLDRSGKDVTLTPAGRVLFTYAERLLQMRDESLLAVADQGSTPRGTLLIGANEATCLYVLPDVFAKFCHLYPGVQISIYRNFSYKIIEKLENGSIDVGIVTLPVKSSSLKSHPIFRDQLMLMVSPQSPLAKHDVVPVSEIAKPHGTRERRHDQEFCCRRAGGFAYQREFRAGSGSGGESEIDSHPRRRTVARTRFGLQARSDFDPGDDHLYQHRPSACGSFKVKWHASNFPIPRI